MEKHIYAEIDYYALIECIVELCLFLFDAWRANYSIRLKKKILCLKAAARICFSVRIWFCKIQTFIFFFLKLFFFHFYNEKRRKFAVLEEFKHVGTQKTCKIRLISENTEVETFQSFLVLDVRGGKGQLK